MVSSSAQLIAGGASRAAASAPAASHERTNLPSVSASTSTSTSSSTLSLQRSFLAEGYLRQTLKLAPDANIPPFIVIHVRHGDFLPWCGDVPKEECFAPLSAYATRVREVQDELRERLGLYVNHVIMTGDEKDPAWWEGVQEYGWIRIDHKALGTAEEHGNWYPVVLDAVVQSMAMGFVGTDRSTFSHMARRRVADWNKGATRMVKWGYVGADDH